MNCPKSPETFLRHKLTKEYPEVFGVGMDDINPEHYPPDTEYRIEPEIEYDKDAPADLVIRNALLANGQIKDIAVAGNLIIRVCDSEELKDIITSETEIIDANEKSVSPGFVDSHLHLDVAMQRLGSLNVEEVKSSTEFKDKLVSYAEKNQHMPFLQVFGLHYFDDPIIPAENCRDFLDELVEDKPLLIFAHDMHTVWGNTKALDESDMLKPMPPYPHLIEELDLEDKIVTDKKGIPTGEFKEPEVYSFLVGPLQSKFPKSIEQQLEDLETVCLTLAAEGITGVHRMALAQPSQDISFLILLFELEQSNRLPIRVSSSFSAVADHNMLKDVVLGYNTREFISKARNGETTTAQLHEELTLLLKAANEDRHQKLVKASQKGERHADHPKSETLMATSTHIKDVNHGSYVKLHLERDNPHTNSSHPDHLNYHSKIRLDTLKIFMDGVIEKDTAYRTDQPPSKGIPEFNQADLNTLLEFADRLGIQVAAHTIGDGSVKSILDAIANARKANSEIDRKRGHKIPHRIEHIEICRHEDIPRFGLMHTITSMQPLHERPPMTLWHTLIPENEWNTAFAWKENKDNGAILVFGSDWPIVSCNVRKGIHHAVSRKPWKEKSRDQSVDIETALAAYTSEAAYSEFCQNIKGAIKPGMLADIVILSGNIRDLQNGADKLEVMTTICDGKIIYRKDQ